MLRLTLTGAQVQVRRCAEPAGARGTGDAMDETMQLAPPFSARDVVAIMEGLDALRQWTGKATATILYDSDVDPFNPNALFNKVRDRPNIAVVAFTTDKNVFGGYYSVAVTEQNKDFYDRTLFVFSFESQGRCMTPQRFVAKRCFKDNAYVNFYRDRNQFVYFGVANMGGFSLGNMKSETLCSNLHKAFEGLDDTTLTGNTYEESYKSYHHCVRLVALQFS